MTTEATPRTPEHKAFCAYEDAAILCPLHAAAPLLLAAAEMALALGLREEYAWNEYYPGNEETEVVRLLRAAIEEATR